MSKRLVFLTVVLYAMLSAFLLVAFLTPAQADTPRILLYTVYEQFGWGDNVEAGCVDDQGRIWEVSGSGAAIDWPYDREQQLEYLSDTSKLTQTGELTHEELFVLKSLVAAVEDQGTKVSPGACDAGCEYSYAVQYDRDGHAKIIMLGASGDDVFENTDPDAQALYMRLRELFPNVNCYAGDLGIGPVGFKARALSDVLGYNPADIANAKVKATYIDCEAGPRDVELDEQDEKTLREFAMHAVVVGKYSNVESTGGYYVVSYYNAGGECVLSIQLEGGHVMLSDGQYCVESPASRA